MPVCAPGWLAENPIAQAVDLRDKPLLVLTSRRDAWARWFQDAGVAPPVRESGPTFEHFLMLAQAAAAGAGVALVPKFLVEPELEAGILVVPIDRSMATDEAYYLVYPEARLARPMFPAFRDWILREARGGTR